MNLLDYIEKHYGGNQAAFARHMGVQTPQVTQWINQGVIIENQKMYTPKKFKREIPAPPRKLK